jgi:carbon starvation protein
VLLYRTRLSFALSSVIGVAMLAAALWLGTLFPLQASYGTWMVVFFFYIVIAAALPVNILLQPRDYLNSYLLYAGLLIGLVAAVFAVRAFEVPAFSSFAPVLMSGKATPFWPAIPLIIACGSLSGFHSLVASGTTSKQLENERDALPIGFGAMLTEGFLSTIVIVSIAAFGFTALRNAGAALNVPLELTADNWGALFTKASGAVKLGGANLFVQSYADMVSSTWLAVVPGALITVLAGMWVATFAMTTLDTTNRLGRYCLVEICAPLKDSVPGFYGVITNRWIASLVPAAIGIYLAWSGQWLVIWGAFGAANQLIASVALLTVSTYVAKRIQSRFSYVAMVPALLLWVTVTAAIIWLLVVVMPASIAATPVPGWVVAVLVAIMLVLNVVFILDFFRSYFGKEPVPPVTPAKA